MGRHSCKQNAFHKAYLEDGKRRAEAFQAAGVPLPGQGVVHRGRKGRLRGTSVPIFQMSDGRIYAIARDGSFRRAPDGPVMRLPGGDT